MLSRNVEKAGGKIFFAEDAQAASNYVLSVANAHNVEMVVKSKSMLSEEMGLNERLEAEGIEAVETDLGEYIIQLAGETPFHIIAPAIHKSAPEVAELFADKLGSDKSANIEELGREARRQLRAKFMSAGMGISGANFLVAESGTVGLVTNEGNGRMCTSMPKVHVAVAGMEKVIPSLEDLGMFLRLLIRSATGQMISSYVTTVTGPRRDEEEDGPEEFHLVIVDNGRSRILADPEMREALTCLRLRRLHERLPGLSQSRRTRLRLGLSRPHRRARVADADRAFGGQGFALRIHAVRRVQRGLPGQHRHSPYAAVYEEGTDAGRQLPGRALGERGGVGGDEGLAGGDVVRRVHESRQPAGQSSGSEWRPSRLAVRFRRGLKAAICRRSSVRSARVGAS